VITNFIESWPLFAESYLLGISLALLLPLLGVLVIIRQQVFVAMAISQTSLLGMAFGLVFQHELEQLWLLNPWIITMLFPLLASILCLKTDRQSSDRRNIATVMVFILSTTGAYLLLSQTPVGLKEVQERMSSSLISSSMVEVYWTLGLFFLVAVFWWNYQRHIVLVCVESTTARAMGLSVLRWEILLSVLIGLGLGWAVNLTGWLFTFGCLIFPVYIARHLAQSITQVLFISPLLGAMLNLLAYVLAHYFDIPFSHMAVALMGMSYLMLALSKKSRTLG
jgi:zinc transport system permease protein